METILQDKIKDGKMKMFEVYSLFDLTPVRAKGSRLWDDKGEEYLDLYGGHAVISVGHSHPHYVKTITEQLQNIGFYSNSVKIPIQEEVAELLGKLSGYEDYRLFMINSGAEANENAIKLASFYNGKKKVIAFSHAFHGRTSVTVAATDNQNIVAPVNETENVIHLDFNDEAQLEQAFADHEISSVVVEGIQGVGGIQIPTDSFLQKIEKLCHEHNAVFILDEVQSGYGRTGKFFAHQWSGVKPDLITMAKGMGNGFPVAGVLISPKFEAKKGMLGTTFGGNYLACAASLAVLQIMEKENLMENVQRVGAYLEERLTEVHHIREVRNRGLMTGVEFDAPAAELRLNLLKKHHILVGNSSDKNTLRILPALTITEKEVDELVDALKEELND